MADRKAGPSYSKYTMIGALLGALLAMAVFTARYIMDDTIHTGEDLERYFGIVPLTTIPESEALDDSSSRSRKRRKLFKLPKRKK